MPMRSTAHKLPIVLAAPLCATFLASSVAFAAAPAPAVAQTAGEARAEASSGGGSKARRARRSRPAPARIAIRPGGLDGGRAEIMSPVRVNGMLAPYVAGQRVEVTFFRNGRPARRKRVEVRRGGRNYGVFRAVVRPNRPGKWAAAAVHRANRKQRGARTIRKSWKLSYPSISSGQCGPLVVGFKRGLARMGYITNGGRCLGARTERGILAFRRVNGMSQSSVASPEVVEMAYRSQGGFRVRHPGAEGVHMEVPLDEQVLVFADGAQPLSIYPVSTGKPSTPTVTGSFRMQWTQPGYNRLDMYYSWYFYRGYAVHGYKSVPDHPASNGCIRTFLADQPEVFNRISEGDQIFIW